MGQDFAAIMAARKRHDIGKRLFFAAQHRLEDVYAAWQASYNEEERRFLGELLERRRKEFTFASQVKERVSAEYYTIERMF